MDAKMFGAFLARVRREQGLTQAELAEQLHVTDKAVSRWERGVGLPDINTLEPLADALGLSLADLMHCHDPAQEPPTAPVPLEEVSSWHCGAYSPATEHLQFTGVPSAMVLYKPMAGCPRGSFFRFWPEWNFSCWNSGTALNRAVSITVTLKRAPFWIHRFYA